MTWIQTFDGRAFDLADPQPTGIDPVALATCLGRLVRFAGHTRQAYTVAQHSVLVSRFVRRPELRLPALLHDAHEAYSGFGDVSRPAKQLDAAVAAWLDAHERRIDAAIAARFGFDPILFRHPEVKEADLIALATEARDLLGPPPRAWDRLPPPDPRHIDPWKERRASSEFLVLLRMLTNTCPDYERNTTWTK